MSTDTPSLLTEDPTTPEQLLAMKIQAGRPIDAEDIATLCQLLDITTVDEVEGLTRIAFPDDEPSPKGLDLARDLLAPSPAP